MKRLLFGFVLILSVSGAWGTPTPTPSPTPTPTPLPSYGTKNVFPEIYLKNNAETTSFALNKANAEKFPRIDGTPTVSGAWNFTTLPTLGTLTGVVRGATGALSASAIADADVPDTITASNYLPLAGGTVTGATTFQNYVTLGNDAGDLLTVDGRWNSAMIPFTSGNIDFGSASYFWGAGYFNSMIVGTYTGIGKYASGILSMASAGTDYMTPIPTPTSTPSLFYYRGDLTWATLNQAAVAGLTTADTPTFAGGVYGADGTGNRNLTMYSATAGMNLQIYTTGASAAAFFRVPAAKWITFIAPAGFELRTGDKWYFQDSDAANATMATIDSATGTYATEGNVTLNSGGTINSTSNGNITIAPNGTGRVVMTGGRQYETYEVHKTIARLAVPDATTSSILKITTVNETGDNDGGGYRCDMKVHVFSGANGTDEVTASKGGHYWFSRAVNKYGAGTNTAVEGATDAASARTDVTLDITTITPTVTETTEYLQTVNLNVELTGTLTTCYVVCEVDLEWYGFLTSPTITGF